MSEQTKFKLLSSTYSSERSKPLGKKYAPIWNMGTLKERRRLYFDMTSALFGEQEELRVLIRRDKVRRRGMEAAS
ncbi:MAG: hypothetical protein DMG62_23860 [Acidobacteria bacterium]|nr:MAG: hypothetical protein DMG62_23860 [Acidobacteriota bacterium]